jgi:hypothetical protein
MARALLSSSAETEKYKTQVSSTTKIEKYMTHALLSSSAETEKCRSCSRSREVPVAYIISPISQLEKYKVITF